MDWLKKHRQADDTDLQMLAGQAEVADPRTYVDIEAKQAEEARKAAITDDPASDPSLIDSFISEYPAAFAESGNVLETAGMDHYAPNVKAGLEMGGASILSRGARLMGLDEEADDINRLGDRIGQEAAEATSNDWIADWVQRGIRGTASTVPEMTAGGVIAGPYGAIAGAMSGQGNQAITEARDAGLEGQDVTDYAASSALIEGIPAIAFQKMGLGGVESVVSKPLMRGFGNAIKRLGISTVQEIPEELLTEFSHLANSFSRGVREGRITVDDIAETAEQTIVQTLMTAGTVNAPGLAASAVDGLDRSKRLGRIRSDRQNLTDQLAPIADMPSVNQEESNAEVNEPPEESTVDGDVHTEAGSESVPGTSDSTGKTPVESGVEAGTVSPEFTTGAEPVSPEQSVDRSIESGGQATEDSGGSITDNPDDAGGVQPASIEGDNQADSVEYEPGELPVQGISPQIIRTEDIKVDPERFQFKGGSDESGVTEPLSGDFDPLAAGNLLVWESNDGDRYAVNGHHRTDLAKRTNYPALSAQVVREADGITEDDARAMGAKINILEGQGDVRDYADFFRQTETDEATAQQQGLLARSKGRQGFLIGQHATDDTYGAFAGGKLSATQAANIADIGRGDEGLQALGVAKAKELGTDLRATMSALKQFRGNGKETQGDLFGFDESAFEEARTIGKAASSIINEKKDRVLAVRGALRRPETAASMGLTGDMESIRGQVAEIQEDLEQWNRWETNPELVRQAKERSEVSELPSAKDSAVQESATQGIVEPEKPTNEEASEGDQLGLFGESDRKPVNKKLGKVSEPKTQGTLIDGMDSLPGQMSLIDEQGAPDDMVYRPLTSNVEVNEEGFRSFPMKTMGVPRANMPQVKSEQRGALSNFLRSRGTDFNRKQVLPKDLKPTQVEYSPEKVNKARTFDGPDRAILVSSDGYIVDGHHQWVKNLEDAPNEPMEVVELGGTIDKVLLQVREFPSSEISDESVSSIKRVGPKAPASNKQKTQESGSIGAAGLPTGVESGQGYLNKKLGKKTQGTSDDIANAAVAETDQESVSREPKVSNGVDQRKELGRRPRPNPEDQVPPVTAKDEGRTEPDTIPETPEVSQQVEIVLDGGQESKSESTDIASPSPEEIDAEMERQFDAIEDPEPKKPVKKKLTRKKNPVKRKTSLRKRAEKAETEFSEDLASFLEEARNTLSSGLDPKLAKMAANLAIKGIKAKGLSFAALVEEVYNAAPDMIEKLGPYLESAWRIAERRGLTSESAGNVADITKGLKDEKAGKTGGEDSPASSKRLGRNRKDASGNGDGSVLGGTLPSDVQEPEGKGDSVRASDVAGGEAEPGSQSTDDGGGDELGRRAKSDSGDSSDGAGKRKRAERVPKATRGNYHLANPDSIVGGGPVAKFKRNQQAIEIVRELEQLNREPTSEELDTLAGYTGWGAFGQELFNGSWDIPRPKEGWEERDEWLREHLGEDDWKSAQHSITNAHYTDPETIESMWNALAKMGFTGGRMLEPAMGIGNFFSMMPRDLMERTGITGIELDPTTAAIAKALYPDANLHNKGYEKSRTPDEFYDLIVSNVPFGNYKVPDRRYKQDYSIHNYFFRKAFDQLKPGGVMAFVTSNTTMDGKSQAKGLRIELGSKGELVAAFRMPTGAFQRYAGTKVVADIIYIRKLKKGETPNDTKWQDVVEVEVPNGTVEVNEYFANNPSHVLGELDFGSGTTSGRPGMIVNKPRNLKSLVEKIVDKIPSDIIDTDAAKSSVPTRSNDSDHRQFSVVTKDGDIFTVKGEHLVPLMETVKWYRKGSKPETIEKNRQQIEDLTGVRESLRTVLEKQARGEDAANDRKELNKVYDEFVAKHGPIHKSIAAKTLQKARDPMGYALSGLESIDSSGAVVKRPIFSKNTVRQKRKADITSVFDAYFHHRNDSLDLDIDKVAKLAGVSREQAIKELEERDEIYLLPSGLYEPTDMFLNGNVARKKRNLEAAAREGMEGLERSIAAIEAVMPEPVPYNDIEVSIGATWIESGDYSQFVADLLGVKPDDIDIQRFAGRWVAKIPNAIADRKEATRLHGYPEIRFNRMLQYAMNNGAAKIVRKDSDGSSWVDEAATSEANAKIDELKEKFQDWIWKSSERIKRLGSDYNEMFNSTVTPDFETNPLTFEGLALQRGDDPFSLRSHQERAVWRAVLSGKSINGHEVGTGKSLTMGALAMESRRLGVANKPLLLAHNANSMAVKNEIQEAYPGAKILYVNNLKKEERDQTLAQIAMEDWDLVVVPHSLTDRFEMRPETLEKLLKPEMDMLEAAAQEAFEEDETGWAGSMPADLDNISEDEMKGLRNFTAKELVKERTKLRNRVVKAQQRAEEAANSIFFEDMGIDMVMVDEAHVYKKLPISSKQQLKGLNKAGSQRGSMMMLMSDFVRQNNNGKGIHLFTGTPLTNTLNEIYNMMRLVMPEEMEAVGVKDWDGWFNTFAESEGNIELSSGGTWEQFDRLTKFVNLPELRQMVNRYMDIVFADEMPEFSFRDKREGRTEKPMGRPYKQVHNAVVEMTPEAKAYSDSLKRRYETFRDASGKEKKEMMYSREHNPLVIEGEGVKLAMDPRMVGLKVDPKDPRLKVNKMVANAIEHYHEHPKSTQMIFSETGHSDKAFNIGAEVKRRLIEEGVEPSEIVLFSKITDKAKRAEAAEAMQRGEIRFAIGSTATMGTGVNAQNEMVAMHHLDAPWMPGELEQRNGRGHRQGNRWNTVQEYRYLTEGPQDGRRWQVLLTKAKFIEAFMKNKGSNRSIEMDDVDLSEDGGGDMASTFSEAAGDPRIQMRIKLEKDIEKLERSRTRHGRDVERTLLQADDIVGGMEDAKKQVDKLIKDADTFDSTADGKFTIKLVERLDGKMKTYKKRKDADALIKDLDYRYSKVVEKRQKVGEYRGFDIILMPFSGLALKGELATSFSKPTLQSADAQMRQLRAKADKALQQIENDQEFVKQAQAGSKDWPKQEKLDQKKAKLETLLSEMEANPDVSPQWLRTGAPVNTSVYMDGKEYTVNGHRSDTHVLFAKEDGSIGALPITELTDENGTPVFPDAKKPEAPAEDKTGTRKLGPSASQDVPKQKMNASIGSPDQKADVSAGEVLKTWERIFGVPIRAGGFSGRAAGLYKRFPEVVRLRESHYGNLAVAAHEIAHHIDDTTDAMSAAPADAREEVAQLDYEFPTKSRDFEGFAEYIRKWITDANSGAVVAPQFDKYFKDYLKANPELNDKLQEARKLADQYGDQTVFQRVDSMLTNSKPDDVSFKERFKRKFKSGRGKMITEYLDRYAPASMIDKEFEAKGGEGIRLSDAMITYAMSEGPNAAKAIEDGVHDLQTGEMIGEFGLADLGRFLEGSHEIEDAKKYAYARHVKFMSEKQPNWTASMALAEAESILNYYAGDQETKARFEAFARGMAEYGNDLRKMQHRAGDIPGESLDRMIDYYRDDEGNDYYFPMARVMDATEGWHSSGSGGGVLNRGKSIRGRKKEGSSRAIYDPIDQLQQQSIKAYKDAADARIAELFIEKVSSVPGMGGIADKVNPKMQANQGEVREILDTLVDEGFVSKEDAEAAISAAIIQERGFGALKQDALEEFAIRHNIDLESSTVASDMEQAARDEPDALAMIAMYRPVYRRNDQKRIAVHYNREGKPELWELDGPTFDMLVGSSEAELTATTNLLAKAGQAFKSGAVGLNTAFAVANFFRDWAAYVGRGKHQNAVGRVAKPIPMLFAYAAYRAGKGVGFEMKRADFELFDEMGGKLYSRMAFDFKGLSRNQRRLFSKGRESSVAFAVKNPIDSLKNSIEGLKELVAFSDAPPRLLDMIGRLKEEGWESSGEQWKNTETGDLHDKLPEDVRIKAMVAAGEATVQFKRSGTKGRHIEAYVPFFNATIQSTRRSALLYASLKDVAKGNQDGLQARRYFFYLMAIAGAEAVRHAMQGDDDDQEEADGYIKDQYWTFGDGEGKTVVRIPKPRDEAIVGNLVRVLMEQADGKDRSLKDTMLRDMMSRIPTGGGAGEALLGNYANFDAFTGREIEPSSMRNRAPENRYDNYTTSASKALGQYTGRMLGVGPKRLEFTLDSVTGGVYRRLADTYDGVMAGELNPKMLPGVRAFWRDRHESRSYRDFWDEAQNTTIELDRARTDGKETAELSHKSKQLAKSAELMSTITENETKGFSGRRKYDYQKYLVGIARETLGREPLKSSPHPLLVNDLPPKLADAVTEFAASEVKRGMMGTGMPVKPHKTSGETEKGFGVRMDSYNERKESFDRSIKYSREFIQKYRKSRYVRQAIDDLKESKAYKDLEAGKRRPTWNKESGESYSEHKEEVDRYHRKRSLLKQNS